MRILLLGTMLSPFGGACLKALHQSKKHTLLVGIENPWRKGLLKTVITRLQRFGVRDLVRKGWTLLTGAFPNAFRRSAANGQAVLSLRTVAMQTGEDYFWCNDVHGE